MFVQKFDTLLFHASLLLHLLIMDSALHHNYTTNWEETQSTQNIDII